MLGRAVASALDAIHKLVLLVGSIKRTSAAEAYVQRYLERSVGLDSFTIQYLAVARPALFRLSVSRDIEPAVAWLRSVGITEHELAELVSHTPAILSASVDDQLEPLAALVRQAGGSPREVLLACPDLVQVPVASLQGTRHVLRQLGAPDSHIAFLLLSLPDVYAQLALALRQLFSEHGVAAWKLYTRQRRSYAGLVHHHMTLWNQGSTSRPTAAAEQLAATQQVSQRAAGLNSRHSADDDSRSGQQSSSAQDTHEAAESPTHRGAMWPRSAGPLLLSTTYLLDRQVYSGLVQVQQALATLVEQDDGSSTYQDAEKQLQDAIQWLMELSEVQRPLRAAELAA